MIVRKSRLALALGFFFATIWLSAAEPQDASSASASEDAMLPALTAIAGQGMMSSRAYSDLQDLSDNIGGRVTGSPQAAQAIEWGLARMKAMGLTDVRAEKWELFRGWTRLSADAEMLSPMKRKLQVDALGWVGSTAPGGVEAEVVRVDVSRLDEETKENSSKWAGKILLMANKGGDLTREQRVKNFSKFGVFLKSAYAAHAVAVIGGQGGSVAAGMHLTHTGALGFNTAYEIPVVSMVAEDQLQLDRFLDQGKTIRLKINVQNQLTSGPVETANVVGEILGTEHPEQIVVIGGHLDSWDLAQGSTDDGVGVATTLGAADAILKSGKRPKRTMRFVLFTGEEQGLLGSLAYTKQHQSEMTNHLGAVILDNGQGAVIGLNLGGHDDLIPVAKKFAKSVKGLGELKVDDKLEFGTDAGPFILAGLPGINMDQDSPEYKYTHHSVVDTFDKVKPDILARDTTMVALTAYWIADRPERLTSPWPAERTAKMLVKKKEDEALKAFGIWPFGNLGQDQKPKGNQPDAE